MVLKGINSITILILVCLFPLVLKCSSTSDTSTSIKLNSGELEKILIQHGNNLAVMSCLRCGCFVEAINRRFKQSGNLPKGYVLLADTVCNKFLFPVQHLSSIDIEKLSDEIYNLTLIKKSDNVIETKILQVEDSKEMEMVINNFFRSDTGKN